MAVSEDKDYKTAVDQYDDEHGTYKDDVESMPQTDKLPTEQLPKAEDSSPFKLGPLGR